MQAEVFFKNYADSFLDNSVELVIPFYEFPCTFITKSEILTFQNKEEFIPILKSTLIQYNEWKLAEINFELGESTFEEEDKISFWVYWVFKTETKEFLYQISTRYIVKTMDENWRICGVLVLSDTNGIIPDQKEEVFI
ncbi:MAG: hypothetical protein SFU98_03855 [Leptospiraceae bacterium]|nr:hypothetical protein [Leptospiraceae bacterium]